MAENWADKIAEFLEEKDVRHAFGIIGAGNAAIFDAIFRRGYTEIVCVHHEQAATMAMQTYYRMTGKIGVALVTTGGGSTNAVTGVVSAWMDSMPGLVISGNENSRFTHPDNPLRIWGVQGYDSSAMVEGVTKFAKRPERPEDTLYELGQAYDISLKGRPGPVWLDVPMDYQTTKLGDQPVRRFEAKPPADREDFEGLAGKALELLRGAKRPVLWLGNGIRIAGAADDVPVMLDELDIPALVTWAGIDLADSDHPRVYGRAGVYGQRAANFVLQNADLVLAIGTRLAIPQIGYVLEELVRDGSLIVVDVDPDELAKHGDKVSLRIQADAGVFISALRDGAKTNPLPRLNAWVTQCDLYREAYPWIGPEHDDPEPFINSYGFMSRLGPHLKDDQVIVTDMGTALLSGHQAIRLKSGQRMMTSTGLGEMGYGLPGAIGASFARERGEVMCLNCDGGMMMNLQELQTVAHHQLPIKLFIFNNDGYLMIKHTQRNLFQNRSVGVDVKSGVSCPDFSKLAVAFGFSSFQIRTWEDFDAVMPQIQAAEGPVICEVFMHPNQLFAPKLSASRRADGSIVSPPLEDLSPLLPRDKMRESMIIGLHEKSADL